LSVYRPEFNLPTNIGNFGPKVAQTLTLARIVKGMFAAPRGRREPPPAPPIPPLPFPILKPTRPYDRGAAAFAGHYGVLQLPLTGPIVQPLHRAGAVPRYRPVAAPYGFAAWIAGQVQSYNVKAKSGPQSGPLYTPDQIKAMTPAYMWPAVLPQYAQPVAPTAAPVSLG
jgi:hypothetical protein